MLKVKVDVTGLDTNTVATGLQGSFVENSDLTNEVFATMEENWVTTKYIPEIISAEIEEEIKT